MPRYKLTIEYDGTPFAGWQRQANAPSVQQALEEAVHAMSGETVVVHGAGRTDAGVHALAQVAHIDLSREWRTDKVRDAMNAHLKPQPVAVLLAEAVDDTFEARFSAKARHYVYRILNRRAPPTVMRDGIWHVKRRLDAQAMHDAAQVLIGKHDFSTFRAAECQANSPLRTLDRLDVVRTGETIEIFASARSFLHHQVRSITGSLEHVGSGKWSKQDLKDALDAKDRARCGVVAPASGLYMLRVDY
ncbi:MULTISPECIES: tRNA pseudouridine(38-40) synthase TruA [unclassified Beijerinckia]|uniref:tRNA pseudouridine(38-40) synthase TruA n=1 Tax=unclassified Beijerinckia TaxID=2638183 RepID=UPI00089B6C76|nr:MULTISPECIES: tRNA pseudouridine(38-40) synthase TruA [unclassified Beijerinckia]MDH7796777.1 tRNA pseudouridine38-40 synthase [Beijerinckia sp. GAS462]SEC59388.1 tRNA pseudouridine38-40 synthase [Beijerinckia sp. 28-YEA-48]